MASTIEEFFWNLREFWASTPPMEMWEEAGEFAMMIEKRVLNRMTGTGIGKVSVKDRLNGQVGSNYGRVFTGATTPSGRTFEVPRREFWVRLPISQAELEFAEPEGTVSGESGRMTRAKDTASSFMHAFSGVLWGDGTGRIGKGDGAFNVAAQRITFKNSASAAHFEEGDQVVLIDEAAVVPASGMPVYRALAVANTPLKVTAVGDNYVDVDQVINVAVPTAVNTDYIGKWVQFDGAANIVDGVFRWLPITKTEANTTWAGVNRSLNVNRLSGRRVALTGSESPYDIISKMGVALKKAAGSIKQSDQYCIYVPANEIDALTQSAAKHGITFRNATTPADPEVLTFGVQVVQAAWPGLGTVDIVADTFLHDPNVSDADDKTYVLLNKPTWSVQTGKTGINWWAKDDTKAVLKEVAGTQDLYAQYGMMGDLYCTVPAKQVVASIRAGL